MIVRRSSHVPPFFDKFLDHGMNRLEWINHLRFRGFHFSLFTQSWLYHLRHSSPDTSGPITSQNDKILKIRESELFELYKGQWMLPVCGMTTENHPNPVGMSVKEFLEKKERDKSKMSTRDKEIAERFAKRREYLKSKKQAK